MKLKVITLIAFLALAAGLTQAQTYSVVTPISSYVVATNGNRTNLAAGACTLDVRRQREVAVQLHYQLMEAGTAPVSLTFFPTLDLSATNTLAAPVNYQLVSTPAGTTMIDIYTNWNVYGYGYLQLYSITNSAGNGMITNLSIKYGLKNEKR